MTHFIDDKYARQQRSEESFMLLEELTSLLIDNKDIGFKTRTRVNFIIDRISLIVKESYDQIAYKYTQVRSDFPSKMDREFIEKLIFQARELVRDGILGDHSQVLHLLDVGTGSGRDLRYFKKHYSDVRAIGIDISSVFIKILHQLAEEGEIENSSYYELDMRNLNKFENATFDIVRHNASLLHLPVTDLGLGADEAIAESYRVLKPYGIVYIWAKAGQGLKIIDTNEGLGERIFQLFTEELLSNILKRNGFQILSIETREEIRSSNPFDMIAAFAQKVC